MFDNLRQQAAGGSAYVDPEAAETLEPVAAEAPPTPMPRSRPFLGLNATQRFVLALMLFLNVAVLGCFCLLATERIWLPF